MGAESIVSCLTNPAQELIRAGVSAVSSAASSVAATGINGLNSLLSSAQSLTTNVSSAVGGYIKLPNLAEDLADLSDVIAAGGQGVQTAIDEVIAKWGGVNIGGKSIQQLINQIDSLNFCDYTNIEGVDDGSGKYTVKVKAAPIVTPSGMPGEVTASGSLGRNNSSFPDAHGFKAGVGSGDDYVEARDAYLDIMNQAYEEFFAQVDTTDYATMFDLENGQQMQSIIGKLENREELTPEEESVYDEFVSVQNKATKTELSTTAYQHMSEAWHAIFAKYGKELEVGTAPDITFSATYTEFIIEPVQNMGFGENSRSDLNHYRLESYRAFNVFDRLFDEENKKNAVFFKSRLGDVSFNEDYPPEDLTEAGEGYVVPLNAEDADLDRLQSRTASASLLPPFEDEEDLPYTADIGLPPLE